MKRLFYGIAIMGLSCAQCVWPAQVDTVAQQGLPLLQGPQEVSMITVEYQPGEASPVHRHNAHTFVYVLEGSVVMQVEGGAAVTLSAGETFRESPDDIHVVSKNASDTGSAKLLVFFIKPPGVPSTVLE